ncbi:MAG: thioredoxin domain-containing protein [Chthonomonadales bacterium]
MAAKPQFRNRLAQETSPYLLQHAHNPVDWYPWGEEAFSRAKSEGKPILLSVGYAACHWCHVMERECFEDLAIASLMNRHFINVKVDREERPDVDQVYMTAVQLLTGQGGWPLTVFLTPDGTPFYGGTYFPPQDRYGRPGFPRVLQAVAAAWDQRRQEIQEQAGELLKHIEAAMGPPPEAGPLRPALLDEAFNALRSTFDEQYGGFGGAPKFPQPMLLDLLLRYERRARDGRALAMAEKTLQQMAMGGIHDQVAGGFHRYSTDAQWLVPHFEKMLYDNAQLASVYLNAFRVTGNGFYRTVCEDTLHFLLRDLRIGGSFAASLDADAAGVEGSFVTWTPEEVHAVLPAPEADLVCRFYGIMPQGNYEGRTVLHVAIPLPDFADQEGVDASELAATLARARGLLLSARKRRPQPARDDKIIAAWNGLALSALAGAAGVLECPEYAAAAEELAQFLLSYLVQEHRVYHTGIWVGEEFRRSPIPGFLDDYACIARGLLDMYALVFQERYAHAAMDLAEAMAALFADGEGALYNTSHDIPALPSVRPRDWGDNASPSGASVAAEVFLRLGMLFGRSDLWEVGEKLLGQYAAAMEAHPAAFGAMLQAVDLWLGPREELAVIGSIGAADTDALIRAARRGYHPNLMVVAATDEAADESPFPALRHRRSVAGRAAAYYCRNGVCSRPVTEPQELEELLNG